ncbi:MAG: hypothetical protein R3360_07395, partial [Alphaproteobacteria bacterium]|nr:hypothetical protein [Alphaproteobacteria bacterium]
MSTKVDLMSPEEMADPSVSAHRLLSGPRAQLYEGFEPPFYVVSRYRDVSEVLMNPETFISGKG